MDDINEYAKQIAQGVTPTGLSDFFQKLDPTAIGNALKNYLGLSQPTAAPGKQPGLHEPLPRYNPVTGGIDQPGQSPLPPIGGGFSQMQLPGNMPAAQPQMPIAPMPVAQPQALPQAQPMDVPMPKAQPKYPAGKRKPAK